MSSWAFPCPPAEALHPSVVFIGFDALPPPEGAPAPADFVSNLWNRKMSCYYSQSLANTWSTLPRAQGREDGSRPHGTHLQ